MTSKNIYQLCFVILSVALASSLVVPAYPKKAFYLVGYLTVLFLLVQGVKRKLVLDKSALILVLPILLLGLVRVIWSRVYADATFTDVVDNYFQGGKIIIISAFVSYFFIAWRHYLSPMVLRISVTLLFIGLLATLGTGIYEYTHTHQRIKLLTDSAGTVSYLITALALSALFIVNKVIVQRATQIAMFAAIFIVNMLLMFLTESRAAVLALPGLYLLCFYLTHRWAGKYALTIFAVLILGGVFLMPSSIMHRLDNIQSEIDSYQNNNDTSIGARFSIWKGGYHSISWTLLGQSPDDRTGKARLYINEKERANPEAYKNVMYHLHDDLLETLSLQGIAGALSLILFYFGMIVTALRFRALDITLLPLSIIIFGLTDTVWIQSGSVFILMAAIIISYSLMKSTPKE
ncbi:O-antigen ligase family protein [Candidatus Pantoea floridensis]|uniref:O-antigen ligase family protein n=1 Tax=Candidatus Pantoea floridensis TaxID=1938870 RepID=UPI002A18BD8D|nr:O-antigen ligase family protein [Pantoea floridensis]